MADTAAEPRPAVTPTSTSTTGRPREPATLSLAVVLAVVASILGLIVLAWTVLYVTKGRFLKPYFERYAGGSAERRVAVAGDFQLYFDPFDIKFVAEGITIQNPEWATKDELFKAKRIDMRVASFPLIWGTQRVKQLSLVDGALDMEWNADGRRNTWTLGDPNEKGEPFKMPTIVRANVAGTTLRYIDPKLFLRTDVKFDTLRASDTQFADDLRFTGDGTLRRRPFTMQGAILSPNETIAGGRNRLTMRAVSGRDKLGVDGTLRGATVLEGADLKVRADGPNLAGLFELLGVVTPETRRYTLTSDLTKVGGEWRFTRMKGGFGVSDLTGRMTISLPNDRLLVDADIVSRKVDIVDIGPFIGYEPEALATVGVKAAVHQTGSVPRLLPDAPLRADSIGLFDAKVRYKVAAVRAPNLPVSNVTLNLVLDRSLLTMSPLTFDLAGGFVTADVRLNARRKLVRTSYDIRMSPTPMGKLLAGFGVAESGTTGVIKARVQMTGEGDSLRASLASSDGRIAVILPQGTFWARNIQLAELDLGTFAQKMFQGKLKEPVQINCGLIGFTVRDGIATADPILIDTRKNVMLGRGGFSFKDESIDLAFRADSKKFSMFAGQSPIGINGHFAAPGYKVISPELLARAGASLGLALVAAPVAAVVAFVDVGDAKTTACGPVLAGARATAQRTVKGDARTDVGKGTKAEAKSEEGGKRKKFLGIF
ncbi:AsmA family protein [Sphingomonas prati]|uniref:AsmA domain-containing protein n=1 Tax=Sphingomonas prati TaxID=1843237 RepID=A0A7W9BSX1_9SPHN|nr:AsmA family protein [Sphingomonas prati]MBB5729008.1 hypothetical protein [Sphingomonas prati]